jgi:hypothetical protein
LSGDFDSYWSFHIEKDQRRIHPRSVERRSEVDTPKYISNTGPGYRTPDYELINRHVRPPPIPHQPRRWLTPRETQTSARCFHRRNPCGRLVAARQLLLFDAHPHQQTQNLSMLLAEVWETNTALAARA